MILARSNRTKKVTALLYTWQRQLHNYYADFIFWSTLCKCRFKTRSEGYTGFSQFPIFGKRYCKKSSFQIFPSLNYSLITISHSSQVPFIPPIFLSSDPSLKPHSAAAPLGVINEPLSLGNFASFCPDWGFTTSQEQLDAPSTQSGKPSAPTPLCQAVPPPAQHMWHRSSPPMTTLQNLCCSAQPHGETQECASGIAASNK